jgi:hypothetical protein
MPKIKFKKIKVAYGLIKDTKGYLISFFRLLTHPLMKVITFVPFHPLLLLVDYPT